MDMDHRPKHSVSRVNYAKLADVKIPLDRKRKNENLTTPVEEAEDNKLYCLSIVLRILQEGLVKVRYVGYRRELDEWKLEEEVLNLSEESDSDEGDHIELRGPVSHPISVFEELAFRVKALLISAAKQQVFRVPNMFKLNDLLGERWYMRELNSTGDFCYIVHETVELYLKQAKGRPDYQWLENGRMVKTYFEAQEQLVLPFLRGDGIASQWNTYNCK